MARLRYLYMSSGWRFVFLPLTFIIFVAIFTLVSPYSSSYATDGYLTRDRSKFDGFMCGGANPNLSADACNAFVYGFKRNNNYNYVGYYGNYPYVYYPKNGYPNQIQPYSNTPMGGMYAKAFETSLVPSGTTIGAGFDYQSAQEYSLQNSFQIPDSWFGNKVVVSWDFDIGSYVSGGNVPTHEEHGGVVLNWGQVTVRQLTLDACKDVEIPFAFVNTDVMDNDFVSFSFDFTNVTKSQCSYWDWYLTATPTTLPQNGWRYLLANFTKTYNLFYISPYIAYDIVPPESGGDLEGIVDDWKTQQEQEFEWEKEQIENATSSAQSAGSAILSAFNFTIGDPLLGLFSLFTDNSCVNIPIIGDMIHVNNKQVCSPWSAQVRQVLTPVFTIGGTLLLWGFVISWLRNDGAMLEISEGSDPMSPYVGGTRTNVGFKRKG